MTDPSRFTGPFVTVGADLAESAASLVKSAEERVARAKGEEVSEPMFDDLAVWGDRQVSGCHCSAVDWRKTEKAVDAFLDDLRAKLAKTEAESDDLRARIAECHRLVKETLDACDHGYWLVRDLERRIRKLAQTKEKR